MGPLSEECCLALGKPFNALLHYRCILRGAALHTLAWPHPKTPREYRDVISHLTTEDLWGLSTPNAMV